MTFPRPDAQLLHALDGVVHALAAPSPVLLLGLLVAGVGAGTLAGLITLIAARRR